MRAVMKYMLSRQKASLAPNSSRDEDTLNSYLFELVKAGQISEAAKTCMECGQPWRAASLLGGGPYGPEPLGTLTNPGCLLPNQCQTMRVDSSLIGLSKVTVLQIAYLKIFWYIEVGPDM